ncbi:MAG: DUF2130 domain-containing protein [Chitinophagaceae bacterium]|nr:MAG: DUF2130 domain-containing protein [Chitinophagaceae bacterium]
MSNLLKCPNCQHEFELTDSIKNEVREEMNLKAKEWKIEKEKEMRKEILLESEARFKSLEQVNFEKDEKLKQAQQKEVDYLRKEQALHTKESEIDLIVQHKLQTERSLLSDELRKIEEQKSAIKDSDYQLRLKEKDKLIEDQKKLVDEMKRKSEQGSMQLQGEVQELALEEMLRNSFPFDQINPIEKGIRGADCIQVVRNNVSAECGKIIFESKRTKEFSKEWIEKLKANGRSQNADVAVLVTQTFPADMKQFGEKDGVWICSFAEVKPLTYLLRDGILKLFTATKSQEGKGDKMHLLYDYMTSPEFSRQWRAVAEVFSNMKQSIEAERNAMEKLWKNREKQLEKALLNSNYMMGSIEGIAGKNSIDLNLLGNSTDTNGVKLSANPSQP